MALFRSMGAGLEDDNTGTEPIDVRKDLAGLFTGAGVLPGSSSPLVVGTAGFAYQVNAGSWVTSRGASDGVHLWGNDGPVSVSTSVAPGSGLSRIDIIYALHPANGENGDTTSEPELGVAQGTAASSPVAPTLPTGALELARNTMTSAATTTASAGNTITQTAAVARLQVAPATSAELSYSVAVSTGTFTASTNIANRGITDVSATYDRVVEFAGIVNVSGIAASSVWQVVVTSTGAVVSTNVIAAARLPFTTSIAVGGSATVAGAFDLPAGSTCNPRLWIEELSGTGTCTISDGSFRYRIRPKGWIQS